MFKRILVPFDGSETSRRALDLAISLANESGGRLRIVHVVEAVLHLHAVEPGAESPQALARVLREDGSRILHEGLERAKAAGADADGSLFDDFSLRIGEAVAKAAKLWNADLVVVGTHGRRGFSRALLGSGAEQVIRQSPVAVLTVRAPEGGYPFG